MCHVWFATRMWRPRQNIVCFSAVFYAHIAAVQYHFIKLLCQFSLSNPPPHFLGVSKAWCVFLSRSSSFIQKVLRKKKEKLHQQDTLGNKLLQYEGNRLSCLFCGSYQILLLIFTITVLPCSKNLCGGSQCMNSQLEFDGHRRSLDGTF